MSCNRVTATIAWRNFDVIAHAHNQQTGPGTRKLRRKIINNPLACSRVNACRWRGTKTPSVRRRSARPRGRGRGIRDRGTSASAATRSASTAWADVRRRRRRHAVRQGGHAHFRAFGRLRLRGLRWGSRSEPGAGGAPESRLPAATPPGPGVGRRLPRSLERKFFSRKTCQIGQ